MKQDNRTSDDKLKRSYHLLLCLRPAVMENLSRNCSSGSPFKHLRVKSFDAAALPTRIPPHSLPSPASEKDAAGLYKKKASRRKFVRLIKAVLFETSLANKIKKRAKKKKQLSNNGESPPRHDNKTTYPITAPKFNKKFSKKDQGKTISSTPSIETSSTYASSSHASSTASSTASASGSKRYPDCDFTSTTKEQQIENGKEGLRGYYGINTGLSLLLVALLVLVLWGKLFAILCTSAWLFFVPNWRQVKMLLLKSKLTSKGMDKEDHSKKIIMEGLLDRN